MRRPKAFSWWPGHPKYSVGGNPARVHLTRHASSEYFRLYPPDAPSPSPKKPGELVSAHLNATWRLYIHELLMSSTPPNRNPLPHKQFAKIRFDLLIAEKVCEISQHSQNPWVSRCVLHLAMETAPKLRSRRELKQPKVNISGRG